MKRIVKDPTTRRAELLEAAGELFRNQGYVHTTVDAIIQKVGVAKGTFYYYFKSKEEILEAFVQSMVDTLCEEYKKIADDSTLPVMEKVRQMLRSQSHPIDNQAEWMESLHRPENRELHERLNIAIILKIAPVLAQVIEQGNKEAVFHVENALETVQFLLAGSQFLLESGIFPWEQDEQTKRLQAMQVIIERSLGAEPGSFSFL
ncbi:MULTISPECIES: TetR/AcrR family transcriptional regulator [Brevibacillus]|uniref:TetR/AcrR family transcriptional regulator n=1 Tax=Brevibacillus TaxID=55080 RepID=UPI000D0E7B25|nr:MULTISPECIES: TetR/AcrR family transcriptional regulator [Brevibacillus]MED1945295.1 TetR/AcrR family transcriptional regulator [Brevibacillus formosus]MED1998582.1 TetR/AcrR family transcriptional regulator [Brevibacillus formosus]MED2083551.1 TetR/AcrR family transcriptional regulator [Brevibacillus formosus]PSK20944.1 TetR/AcrR family transcriptional regulator [Brevibacillus sp. NRRL NRS-603]